MNRMLNFAFIFITIVFMGLVGFTQLWFITNFMEFTWHGKCTGILILTFTNGLIIACILDMRDSLRN